MSATLWITTEPEEMIDLGGTLHMYSAFADMSHVAGVNFFEDWPDLDGVMTVVEDQEDADLEWLADVKDQAKRFLDQFGGQLGEDAKFILEALIQHGAKKEEPKQ